MVVGSQVEVYVLMLIFIDDVSVRSGEVLCGFVAWIPCRDIVGSDRNTLEGAQYRL